MSMERELRVLLLVAEPLRADDGGGNTAINFFDGMDAEFAQIYCSDLMPKNSFCTRYYQISEQERIKNFFSHKKVGHVLTEAPQEKQASNVAAPIGRSLFRAIKTLRWEIFITARHLLAMASNWKTEDLKQFIVTFDPDVVYAPCYASPFLLALTRYVKELTGKKVLTWSADDNYSLRQFSLSPFYWLNRFWVRSCLRKTYPYYDSFYSISEDEIEEMTPVVGKEMKILRKGIHTEEIAPLKETVNTPIRMVYAGGIYIQRWKTLQAIGEVLRKINDKDVKIVLDIYTQNQLTSQQEKALNDGRSIFTHPAVNLEQLKEIYHDSDIAIHCESFALKNRLTTRLSFSTKIIDCLASGCAVLAVAWEEQTGLKYLKSQDAAICVTDLKQLETEIRSLVSEPERILAYAEKARVCGLKNHDIRKIQDELYSELKRLSQECQ